jgi:hypothetical protein
VVAYRSIIDLDPSVGIEIDADFREPQVLDLWAPAGGNQNLLCSERAFVGKPGLERATFARNAGH